MTVVWSSPGGSREPQRQAKDSLFLTSFSARPFLSVLWLSLKCDHRYTDTSYVGLIEANLPTLMMVANTTVKQSFLFLTNSFLSPLFSPLLYTAGSFKTSTRGQPVGKQSAESSEILLSQLLPRGPQPLQELHEGQSERSGRIKFTIMTKKDCKPMF